MAKIGKDDALAVLASELDAACAQLERLGALLVANPDTAMTHLHELQLLDHVGQRCASVAAILRSSDIRAASRGATLESITDRIGRSPAERSVAASGDVTWFS